MSALVSAEEKLGSYTPASNLHPHSMKIWGSDLTEEICGRSVYRSKYKNFDFNDILANNMANTMGWTDPSFNFDNMFEWKDMNVNPNF